jgi:hypothetical protein
MRKPWRFGVMLLLSLAALAGLVAARPETRTSLRFEVTVAGGLLPAPRDGRVLVVLGRKKTPEPRTAIGQVGLDAPPVLGCDADKFQPGGKVVLDDKSLVFPIARLADLPRGDYVALAVFAHNRDLRFPGAPGDVYSEPVAVTLDPARGGVVRLELTRRVPEEEVPKGEGLVRFEKVRSERLTKFHGRPVYLRAGVILPEGYDREAGRRYPLRVHVGGYGTRYTAVRGMRSTPPTTGRTATRSPRS